MRCGIDVLCAVAALASGAFASETVVSDVVDVCGTGSFQSPIELHPCRKTINGEEFNIPAERPKLKLNYLAPRAELKKVCETDGCNLHVTPKSDVVVENMLEVPGVGTYALDFCVVRIPSEHTVNHNTYAMELQCHHSMENTDKRRKGILSVLLEAQGTHNEFVAMLEDKMPRDHTFPSTIDFGFGSVLGTAGATRYYSYQGSQTTGDCREGVDWFIMYDPSGVDQAQIDKLKNNMTNHPYGWKPARALQKLYGQHPGGCNHHPKEEGVAAPNSVGALSLALVVCSLFVRA